MSIFLIRFGDGDTMGYLLLLFSISLYYLIVATSVVIDDKDNYLKYLFHRVCIFAFGWTILIFFVNISGTKEEAHIFRVLTIPTYSLLYPSFLHFVLELTGRKKYVDTNLKKFLLYLPWLFSIVIYGLIYPYTPEMNVKGRFGWHFVEYHDKGLFYDGYFIVVFATYILYSIYCLIKYTLKIEVERERRAARNVLVGIVFSGTIGVISDYILPRILNDPMPRLGAILLFPAVALSHYSILRYDFMEMNLQNVLAKVLQTVDEAIILVDKDNLIVYSNMCSKKFMPENTSVIGQNIYEILDLKEFDKRKEITDQETTLSNNKGEMISIFLSKSTLRDEWDDIIGIVYVFRDISMIKKAHSDLQLLNEELESRIDERTKELNELNNNLRNELEAREKMQNKIDRLSYYDSLTNLPNRVLLINELDASIKDNRGIEKNIALLYFDIDRFKLINETLGNSIGDSVLIEVAHRLERAFNKKYLVARMGADEYVVIVKEFSDMKVVEDAISKIKAIFNQNFKIQGKDVSLNVSIGVAIYPIDAKNAESLLKNADLAMHKAKELPENSHRFVSIDMKHEIKKDFRIRNDLKEGLKNGDLELYYQPQVDSQSGYIIGNEALIRWNHKEMGFMSPGVFIPVAEKYGLMNELDDFVMDQAIKQNKMWQDKGILKAPVSINLSPKQFMSDLLVEKVQDSLEKYGMEPKFIEIELTESVLLGDISKTISIITDLNKLGVKISIDDFGTEYSSLNYLKMLPANRLKIAKAFIDGINKNVTDEAIIDSIVVLTDKIGIDLIAEGVEEYEQMLYLRNKGCTAIQGFYYYKPMSVSEIEEQSIFEINSYKRV